MATPILLLVFIHGFKGDEETFYEFPKDIQTSLSASHPTHQINTLIYPKYETRGDLSLAASSFKEFITACVLRLESTSSPPNPNPIYAPNVSVILVAHSMGGFVAADALFEVLDDRVARAKDEEGGKGRGVMFPNIKGVLAFDTPYNGLSRSMFAYGAFSQYQNVTSAWNILSTGTGLLSSAGAKQALTSTASSQAQRQLASRSSAAIGGQNTNSNGSWTRWSALAARTGTYGAIMAGGVAAYIHRDAILQSLKGINRENLAKINYSNAKEAVTGVNYSEGLSRGLMYVSRESIGEGFAWMAGHLKFVGALMKTGQLEGRLERLEGLEGVGVKCLFSSLGENGVWSGGYFVPRRTFCAVPSGKEGGEKGGLWREQPVIKAENEIVAHCGMFRRERNDGYEAMVEVSVGLVGEWLEGKKGVRDEWRPSREQLHRSMSENQVWDDDGKVLKPPGGESDVGQLDAILKSEEMPVGEDGGVDEEELKRAASVPLPVDEDVVGEGMLGGHVEVAPTTMLERANQDDSAQQAPLEKENLEQPSENANTTNETNESGEEKPLMTEYEKLLKVEEGQVAPETTKTTLDKSLQTESTSGSVPAQKLEQQDQKQDSTSTTKTWTSMVPQMPSLPIMRKQQPDTSKSNEGDKKTETVGDVPRSKSWLGMVPGMSTSNPTAQKPEPVAKETQEESKSGTEEPMSKSWMGMIPGASSFSAKPQEPTKKEENESKTETDASDASTAKQEVETRKKWFSVV